MKKTVRYIFLISFITICVFSTIKAQIVDTTMTSVYAMTLEELMNTKVTIATKSDQPISETPSIVSVVTAQDIKNMGARELEDVLQSIPGFDLSRNYEGYYGIGVRGVKDPRTTSKILIMMDGTPFNQIFFGNYIDWGYDINLDDIERIEIIRGPGSALYGRNAFSAVINIITKNAKSGDKLLVKGSVGTFNTKSISAYYGYIKNKLNASLAFRKINTDVTDVKFDNGFGEIDRWNLTRDNYSINTNIGFGKFSFNGMFYNLKSGGGFIQNDNEHNKNGDYSLSYNDEINPKFSFKTKISGHNSFYVEEIEQLKSGLNVIIPTSLGGNGVITFADVYPNGVYYNPQSEEYLYSAEAEFKYKLLYNNDLLFGIQSDLHGVFNVIIPSNYDFVTKMAIPGKTRENMDLYKPGYFVNNGHNYRNTAFILQDIWYPVKMLGITLGGRYDLDSQIGGIFNPRAGIVVEPVKNANIKLLFGKAYRAPSPSEQYCTQGFAIGNNNLKPEIINTYELEFSYRFEKMSNSVSVYRNKLTDMIYAARIAYVDPNNKYYNIGKNTSTGIEYENKLLLGKGFYSYFNYSYTVSVNSDTINGRDTTYDHPDVAPHKINLGINYSFLKYFNINLNMFYRSKMFKFNIINTNIKVMDNVGDYAVFNTTLQINDIIKNLSFSLSAYNLFNKKYYSQDNQHLNQPPQPGRQIIANVIFSFK